MSARRPSGSPPPSDASDPLDPDFAADTRAESLWPDTLRAPSTHFSHSRFDPARDARERDRARTRALFNLCHRAVVLRFVLVGQGATALGVAMASSPGTWAKTMATASSVTMVSTLAWVTAVCALKGPLSGQSPRLRGATLAGLGSASALVATAALASIPTGLEPDLPQWVALALSGAAAALLASAWMTRPVSVATTAATPQNFHPTMGPAFLYDAVVAAQALVRSDPSRAEGVLNDLAALLQPVAMEAEAGARLADEVDLAQRYLGIEQVRYGLRLRAACEIDPAVSGALLPLLALPALVAHAARQAVEASQEGGEVTLRAHARGDKAVLLVSHTVSDDADPEDTSGELLDDLRERLRLLHDASGQCEAWREAGAHHVRLVVPL